MGKLESNNTLYLIVVKQVWDRIVSGDKTIEYRERTDYWDKRINARHYDYLRITNGYGNDATRPYRLYRYTGATRVMKDNTQCYAILNSRRLNCGIKRLYGRLLMIYDILYYLIYNRTK